MCGSRAFFSNGSGGNSKDMVYLLLRCRNKCGAEVSGCASHGALRIGDGDCTAVRPFTSAVPRATRLRILRPFTGGRYGGLKHSAPCPRTEDHSTRPAAK